MRLFETAMGVGVERVCNGADGIGVSGVGEDVILYQGRIVGRRFCAQVGVVGEDVKVSW